MYLPKRFEETRPEVLHELMRRHPLGTFVAMTADGLEANHLPFLIEPQDGPLGTLRAHVARANPIWKQLQVAGADERATDALVIFHGPQSYVTPSSYPSKHADGKGVPTWNYVVVHAYGRPRAVDDPAWLLEHVTRQTDLREARQALPWKVSDAPKDYLDRMIASIVGIEMPIARLQGKWKVSQNRAVADRLGVAAGLQSQDTDESLAMAGLVLERTPPLGRR